jgi:hypothetical protein
MSTSELLKDAMIFLVAGLCALKVLPCPCQKKPQISPSKPAPAPQPPPKPRTPWDDSEKLTVGGPVSPDGKTEIQCDLPVAQRTKNVGGTDGAGLCVFSSIGHAARWQNEKRLVDFQEKMKKEPGGGYPEKVDRMIAKYGKGTQYIQYEGKDPTLLKLALKTGRMPSVTYDGHDPHYGMHSYIAHMVNLVYLDDAQACILDNNFIGDNDFVWMTTKEFYDRWTGDGGWAVVLLAPPPPPVPKNQ